MPFGMSRHVYAVSQCNGHCNLQKKNFFLILSYDKVFQKDQYLLCILFLYILFTVIWSTFEIFIWDKSHFEDLKHVIYHFVIYLWKSSKDHMIATIINFFASGDIAKIWKRFPINQPKNHNHWRIVHNNTD
jgi:hypothetical protein